MMPREVRSQPRLGYTSEGKHTFAPRRPFVRAIVFIAAILSTSAVHAQTAYPTKPIRWIVGYTPGGTADMLARAVGQKLTESWGQQVIVENRPGAGTNIGTDVAAKSPPDGYTLFMPTVANVINPTLYPKLPFD